MGRVRFRDGNLSAAHVHTVQLRDRAATFLFITHLNERDSSRATGFPVEGDANPDDLAARSEELLKVFLGRRIGDITDVQDHWFFSF